MWVKHSIETEEAECMLLFSIASEVCLKTYGTPEEQAMAIEAGKVVFKAKLDEYVASAFKVGQKVGKSKADKKDSAMYEAGMVPA